MEMFTIIAGAHGVGKTSFLGALVDPRRYSGEIIDEDKLLSGCGEAAESAVMERIRNCTERSVPVTLKTSLSSNLEEFINELKYAKQQRYKIELFYISIDSMEESIQRIKNRVKRGGRDVPQDEIVRCFENRWISLSKILPYCDEVIFFANDNGFEKVATWEKEWGCIPATIVSRDEMDEETFNTMMRRGLEEAMAGKSCPVNDFFAEIRKTFR